MARVVVPAVKPGDPITAGLWETMRQANRERRLIAGTGVRLSEVPGGTVIDFEGGAADFSHAWQAGLRGTDTATMRTGTINTVEGAIKGVPLSGTEKEPAPVLKFGKPQLDAKGGGYLAAEVTCDPKKDWAIVTVEIVQVADPDTEDGKPGPYPNTSGAAVALSGNRARFALARLRKRKTGALALFQIVCFDLQHRVDLAADGISAARHFFY